MTPRPQTAIRGVFSVGITNLFARLLAYGKHIAITAFIGLSAQLDAFYMATAVLTIVVFAFGDIFDSLGIPRLVETLQNEGEDQFQELAGSILAFAVVLALGLCIFLAVISPWTPWIAPGFTPEKKEYLLWNLLYLAPMAILYLPYHAVGSFLRARRRFQAFYMGEILVAFVSLATILVWHELPYVIPGSLSIAYMVAFLYVTWVARKGYRISVGLKGDKIRGIIRMLVRLLPLYLIYYLFVLVDRTFASYLPTGSVSALSYGLIIVSIPTSILMIENVFITPLAESREKGNLMRQILSGVLIISIPIAFFTAVYANEIVRAVFERGVFTAASTGMTGDALSCFALAIPAFFAVPICTRLFQIIEKLGIITVVGIVSVLLNGALNYAFMRAGMGIKGLALATSLAWYGYFTGYIILMHRVQVFSVTKEFFLVLLISLGISAVSTGISVLVPVPADTVVGLVARGVAFGLSTAVLFYLTPNEDIRYWRETVMREILPTR